MLPMRIYIGLFFFLFFGLGQIGKAQEKRPYKGGYTFNKMRGTADFTYYLTAENEPVLDGPFTFSYKNLDSLTKDNLVKLQVSGEYLAYEKDNSWNYLLEEHQIQVEDIKDRQIVGNLDSKVSELTSNYKAGQLDGRLNYSEKTWLNEAYLETFRTGNLTFSKDRLTGNVLFENFQPTESYKIFGKLNSEGLMDGAWEFEYFENGLGMIEIRRYENGFLIGLQKNNQVTGEKLEEVVFFDAIEKLDSFNQGLEVEYSLSDQFFGLTFNDGFGERSEEFRQQFSGTQLLEDALIRVLKFENEKFVQNGELVKSPIQTRRFRYDLSEEELNKFEQSVEVYGQLKSFLEIALNSNFLKLNQNSTDSLAFTVAYFENVQSKLDMIKPIIETVESGEIYYFDQNFLKENVEELLPERETIKYQFQSNSFEKELEYPSVENSKSLSEDLNAYLNAELAKFRAFDLFISKQQQAFRQNQNLASIEKAILDRKRIVDSLYSSLQFESNEHQELVEIFYTNIAESQYQSLLNTYNQLESFESKAVQGTQIVDLLRFTTNSMEDLGKVAGLAEQIRKMFTVKTFDPFTFETDFEVLEQRNLYQAAITLVKYEYRGLLETKDYEIAENHLINLENLMIQLAKLRQKDTRKLERELVKTGGNINQLKKLLSL